MKKVHLTSDINRRLRFQSSTSIHHADVLVGWSPRRALAKLIFLLPPMAFIIWGLVASYGAEFLIPFGVGTLFILGWTHAYPVLFYRTLVAVSPQGVTIYDIHFAWDDIEELGIEGHFRDRQGVTFTYTDDCKARLKSLSKIHRFHLMLFLPPVSLLSDGNHFALPTDTQMSAKELLQTMETRRDPQRHRSHAPA